MRDSSASWPLLQQDYDPHFDSLPKRRGFESDRFVDVTDRYTAEVKQGRPADRPVVPEKPGPKPTILNMKPRTIAPAAPPARHAVSAMPARPVAADLHEPAIHP
jgi:hypothetical protein